MRIEGITLVIPMLPATAPGIYTVDFRAVSSDGHTTSGTISFEVAGQSTPDAASPASDTQAPANENAQSPADGGGGSPTWLWVALAGGIGLAAIGLLIARAVSRARKP